MANLILKQFTGTYNKNLYNTHENNTNCDEKKTQQLPKFLHAKSSRQSEHLETAVKFTNAA